MAIHGEGVSFIKEGTDLILKMSDLQKCLDTFVPIVDVLLVGKMYREPEKRVLFRTKHLTSLHGT